MISIGDTEKRAQLIWTKRCSIGSVLWYGPHCGKIDLPWLHGVHWG